MSRWRDRIVGIYGHEASGKTTLALHIIAETQKLDGIAAFVDVEHARDPMYAKRIGVHMENLLVSQSDVGEQVIEIVETLVRSGMVDVIVIDPVAALTPQAKIEGQMSDAQVGRLPRLMPEALRNLSEVTNKLKPCVIFTNQICQKIGVIFGSPETTPGGFAFKFHVSVRLEIRRSETLKSGNEVIGNRARVKVVPNKVAPAFHQDEFDVIFGQGISTVGELLDVAAEEGIVQKSSTWFSYNNERLGQGRNNAKDYLLQHSKIASEIEAKIRAHLEVYPPSTAAVPTEEVADASQEQCDEQTTA